MPINSYVVDFCCESARLIVELDGGQHAERSSDDAKRTANLEAYGFLVLRFWNNDVLSNIDGIVETILATASPEPPHPSPLPNGEREHL
jgi:very-short-patch-repair endonuclease